jgi:hypothetical protein
MVNTTIEIIRSALKGDPTVSPEERTRLMLLLRRPVNKPNLVSTMASSPRLIRRKDIARILSCSLRLVDRLAQDGILRKLRLPGRLRAAGFVESEVWALLAPEPQ